VKNFPNPMAVKFPATHVFEFCKTVHDVFWGVVAVFWGVGFWERLVVTTALPPRQIRAPPHSSRTGVVDH
jgi:hypothetical protein